MERTTLSREELAGLYERHFRMVYQICLVLMKNVPDAEDASQTVFRKAMEYPKPMKNWKRAVVGAAAAALLVTGAAAAVPGIGQRFLSCFPAYTENQLYEIDEGHRTGSFSMEDTLFTFLEKFNNENMVNDVKTKKEDGFEYVILPDDENSIYVIVECTALADKLLVVMERNDYKETTGLWQVVAYQILDSETANKMINSGR